MQISERVSFLNKFPLVSDQRVKQFPLMDTPIPTAVFILAYLAWVSVIGPLFMRDRKPFGLKNTLIYYNAFQVLLSAYMFYEVFSMNESTVAGD
jgi:elongation of very long chain fatty acids protein 7